MESNGHCAGGGNGIGGGVRELDMVQGSSNAN